MSERIYIGIDNGTTGSIGVVGGGFEKFFAPATKEELDYTKKVQNVTRIDHMAFTKQIGDIVDEAIKKHGPGHTIAIFIERPMVNTTRFKASKTALRCFESQIIALENLGLGFQLVDSKEWQKVMLPAGIKGAPKLKKASRDIGIRLYPKFKDEIKRQKDADGILIAEWARREKL